MLVTHSNDKRLSEWQKRRKDSLALVTKRFVATTRNHQITQHGRRMGISLGACDKQPWLLAGFTVVQLLFIGLFVWEIRIVLCNKLRSVGLRIANNRCFCSLMYVAPDIIIIAACAFLALPGVRSFFGLVGLSWVFHCAGGGVLASKTKGRTRMAVAGIAGCMGFIGAAGMGHLLMNAPCGVVDVAGPSTPLTSLSERVWQRMTVGDQHQIAVSIGGVFVHNGNELTTEACSQVRIDSNLRLDRIAWTVTEVDPPQQSEQATTSTERTCQLTAMLNLSDLHWSPLVPMTITATWPGTTSHWRLLWNGQPPHGLVQEKSAPQQALAADELFRIRSSVHTPFYGRTANVTHLRVNDLVRIRSSVHTPFYGWGANVTHASVGRVRSVAGEECVVSFAGAASWYGRASELEVVRQRGLRKNDRVVLAPGYENTRVIGYGGLYPGERGTIKQDGGSDIPFKVRTKTGFAWYQPKALLLSPQAATTGTAVQDVLDQGSGKLRRLDWVKLAREAPANGSLGLGDTGMIVHALGAKTPQNALYVVRGPKGTEHMYQENHLVRVGLPPIANQGLVRNGKQAAHPSDMHGSLDVDPLWLQGFPANRLLGNLTLPLDASLHIHSVQQDSGTDKRFMGTVLTAGKPVFSSRPLDQMMDFVTTTFIIYPSQEVMHTARQTHLNWYDPTWVRLCMIVGITGILVLGACLGATLGKASMRRSQPAVAADESTIAQPTTSLNGSDDGLGDSVGQIVPYEGPDSHQPPGSDSASDGNRSSSDEKQPSVESPSACGQAETVISEGEDAQVNEDGVHAPGMESVTDNNILGMAEVVPEPGPESMNQLEDSAQNTPEEHVDADESAEN